MLLKALTSLSIRRRRSKRRNRIGSTLQTEESPPSSSLLILATFLMIFTVKWPTTIKATTEHVSVVAEPENIYCIIKSNSPILAHFFYADLNTNVYGMHGYDNHLIHMHPFFRGRGPAFRSGMEIEPFENINLFPLLCHLLNIQTPPNNGTIVPMLKLLFREGFNVRGAPIGWIIGKSLSRIFYVTT